jgi:hypothetical protein
VLFFDGAEHRDSTCAVGCTIPQAEDERPHLFRIFAHEKPERVSGWTVDRDAVHADIRRLFERWEVFELACDRTAGRPTSASGRTSTAAV